LRATRQIPFLIDDESSRQVAGIFGSNGGLLMLDQYCLMQIQFDWNNNVAPRSAS
jgi:hypothetical protein